MSDRVTLDFGVINQIKKLLDKLGTSGQNQFIEMRAYIVHQSIEH